MIRIDPLSLLELIQHLETMKALAILEYERQATARWRGGQDPDDEGGAVPPGVLTEALGLVDPRMCEPTLSAVDQVLHQISRGLYRVCIDCHHDIARGRMQAQPAVIRCGPCELKLVS
jgi:hypothetical protein